MQNNQQRRFGRVIKRKCTYLVRLGTKGRIRRRKIVR